jgi:mannose-6-phosphate isomerase-like protein (cupin superfamily)
MKRADFLKNISSGILAASLFPVGVKAFAGTKKVAPASLRIIKNTEGEKVNVLGDNMTFKLRGSETNGQYVLIKQNNEPGTGIPMHVHENEDEVFRIVEGSVEFETAGKKVALGPGDVIFCPRGLPHTWRVTGSGTAKVDLSFFPAGLEHMFDELASLPGGPPDMAKVAEICGRYGVRFI